MAAKKRSTTHHSLPTGRPVHDWAGLSIGDNVELLEDNGSVTPACVDTLAEDGSIIWLEPKGTGHRRLWLRSDAVTIYRH